MVAQRQIESDEVKYYQALERTVPDWRTINKDPGFIQWLSQPDGLSGKTRQQLLGEAHNALDAQRVIRFFMTY